VSDILDNLTAVIWKDEWGVLLRSDITEIVCTEHGKVQNWAHIWNMGYEDKQEAVISIHSFYQMT